MTPFTQPEHMDSDSLLREFFKLQSRNDLANLLEIDTSKLMYLLYGERKAASQYKKFEIKKKNGKKRVILAPVSAIKTLQKKLNFILQLEYQPNVSAHGFINGRNILSNAKVHVGKRIVFNVDLKDFFPSINFGRVRGLFLSKPFNFNTEIATILAQLCCYEGALPQGAPTSPVISNMLCVRLDRELRHLARRTNCFYTRYADDITFSTDRRVFHSDVATHTFISEGVFDLSIGSILMDIIETNGYKVNFQKLHISHNGRRKQVTGIVVNEKLNVPRRYIRKIRSMLHAWKKFGLEQAQTQHFEKYKSENRLYADRIDYRAVVKGKIDYLGQVRGKGDYIYNKLYNWFNELSASGRPKLPGSFEEELKNALFVVKCGNKQGTGFLLDKVGLITCNHVVDVDPVVIVHRSDSRLEEHFLKAKIQYSDSTKDLAVLRVDFPKSYARSSLNLSVFGVGIGTAISCVGFPDHKLGENYHKNSGTINSVRRDKRDNSFFAYSNGLFSGQSGGPALDSQGGVAGIISTGSENPGILPRAAEMGIIPLDLLKEFIEGWRK